MNELDRDEVIRKVQKIFVDVLNLQDELPALDARLVEDLGAESVDMISLLLELEEAFGGEIPDPDLAELTTVQSVVDYVIKHSPVVTKAT